VTELASLAVAIDQALSDLEPVQFAMGMEAKDAAHDAIERSVGADRQLSGLGRRARLAAGFDLGNPVMLNLRPKGLIMLADKGRTRTTQILPRARRRRGGRRVAVSTPQGPRASAMSRPSRGNPIIEPLLRDLETRVPKAAQAAITDHVRKALG
jgi:hypothetical protein